MTGPLELDSLRESPHIVVVVRDHMSGVMYSIPHARAIRRRFPDAKITLLTSAYSAPILDGGSGIYDQILPLYTFSDEPGRFDRLKGVSAKFRTWLKLVGRVDLVIHLRYVGDSTLLYCASLGLPPQVGAPQGYRFDSLLSVKTEPLDTTLGSRQRNTKSLEAIGILVESEEMELKISAENRTWAEGWLARRGHIAGQPITIMHPGCHWGCNQWLVERWVETASVILSRRGGSVVVTGSERERLMTQQIVDEVGGPCFNAAGETTLGQFAALISLSTLVVAVDTAPTQICQALKIPSVIMMGDGTISWNGPIEGEPMVMLQVLDPDRPDEICRWSEGACNGPQCTSRLEGITVRAVLESIDHILSRID
jgi:ADP-heptose:LPS heptosyltransferase